MTRVQGELKYSPMRTIRRNPQLAFVRLDNGAANRQPHAHAFGFGREERVEYLVHVC